MWSGLLDLPLSTCMWLTDYISSELATDINSSTRWGALTSIVHLIRETDSRTDSRVAKRARARQQEFNLDAVISHDLTQKVIH